MAINQPLIIKASFLTLLLLAIVLRFYQLGTPDKPVFDEVYFPQYAHSYIKSEPFFHVHPPLANYFFEMSIRSYYAFGGGGTQPESVAFNDLEPVSYRWINAVLGSILCVLVALFCWQVSGSKIFALIALGFIATDGALVVASRFGLNNMHLLFWGFLGLNFAVRAFHSKHSTRYFILAGMAFGGVISIKWNGLGVWMGFVALVVGLFLMRWLSITVDSGKFRPDQYIRRVGVKGTAIIVMSMLVVPLVTYSLLWIPDRMLNTDMDFTEIHKQIWYYHSNAETVGDHPYCSEWYSWPLMQRPISYSFTSYERAVSDTETKTFFKSIHSFGNPLLYWISSLVIAGLILFFFYESLMLLLGKQAFSGYYLRALLSLGFLANWLPWAFVDRCIFLYHYQPASIFSFLGLAYVLSVCFHRGRWFVASAGLVLAVIAVSFIYFLPLQLGLEVERDWFYKLMWFRSWI